MTSTSTEPDIAAWRWLLAACGLCFAAQSFEAWGWPAIDGYPFIERFVDRSFLTSDFYTNTYAGYNVDTAQAYLFGGLERISGIGYAWWLAALNLVRCLVFPALVCALFRALSGSRTVALSGALLGTLSVFALPKMLGWSWLWGDTSTAMFAVPAVVLGWTGMLRRRPAGAMLWFAIAAAIHPLTVVHGLIVLGLIVLVDFTSEERLAALRSPAALASAALFAAVFATQYLLLKGNADLKLPTEEYTRIIAWERHPTDFLPSRFPPKAYLAFALSAAAVVLVLRRMWNEIPRRPLVLATLATYVGICIAGYLFVEVWPIRFWVELMPYRTANIAAPFMLFVLAVFAGEQFRRGHYLCYAALLTIFVLGSPHAARAVEPHGESLRVIAAALLLVVVAWYTAPRPHSPSTVDDRLRPLFSGTRFTALIIGGLLFVTIGSAYHRRASFVIPTQANQHAIYSWTATQTPPDAVFLLDQFSTDGRYLSAVNPQKLRLVGRRAVVASLDYPFLDRDMRPWFARWQVALQGTTPDRVDHADLPTLLSIRRQFPFDYVIRRTPLPPDPKVTLQAVFDGSDSPGRILVYRITDG